MSTSTEIAIPVTRARRTGALAYGPDPSRAFLRVRVTLIAPDGATLDITDRTEQRLGSLSQSVGIDLAELVHDDLDLDLDDSDGLIESLLRGATPDDLWTVVMERETLGRRTRWERIFTGVLDLPDSLTYQRKEQTAELHVFATSKLLERVSAETVARSVTGRTGSVTGGSATVTVTSTTDLLPGDEITLDDGTQSETGAIKSITSATVLKTVDTWGNAFAAGSLLALETRFYRFRSPVFLLDELMTAAGIDYDVVGFPRVNTAIPTDLNPAGLPRESGDRPDSVTIEAGKISIAYSVGSDTGRQVATDPASGFTPGTAATTIQGDWTPYLDTEPATVITAPAALGRDNNYQAKPIAWDYVNGDYWHLEATAAATSELKLFKNSVLNETVDSFVNGNPAQQGYLNPRLEHCPDTDELYLSFSRREGVVFGIYYRPTSAGPVTLIAGTNQSNLRFVRGVGLLMQLLDLTSKIRRINTTTHTISDQTWDRPPNSSADPSVAKIAVNLWSMRRIGRRLVASYRGNDAYEARIAVWSVDGGEVLSHFSYATAEEATWYDGVATVYRWPDGEETYILCSGPVTATTYHYLTVGYRLNAIPYADFDGLSVAGALRELCLIANSTVKATAYGDIRVESRWFYFGDEDNMGRAADLSSARDLPEPLEQESLQLSEFYRESVEVTGTTEAGDSISAIAGDTGASARRETIDSQLVTSLALASAVAAQWAEFLSGLQSQEEVTLPAGDVLYAPLDLVKLAGLTYLVLSADTDLQSCEQDLTLLEI